jgi:predicted O-linked N-acetylglucosamine transferase (SPINDLY family)
MLRTFANFGVDPARIELIDRLPRSAYLQTFNRIDVSLDTWPYHGTMTTCESLWMGVPVVTLAGGTHVSRVGVSLLTHAGLGELVAESPRQFVRIATELAHDQARRGQLRSTLRERMRQSSLMDAPRFARNIEAAYRTMWRAWCETRSG